jgi:hypothetical protein
MNWFWMLFDCLIITVALVLYVIDLLVNYKKGK